MSAVLTVSAGQLVPVGRGDDASERKFVSLLRTRTAVPVERDPLLEGALARRGWLVERDDLGVELAASVRADEDGRPVLVRVVVPGLRLEDEVGAGPGASGRGEGT